MLRSLSSTYSMDQDWLRDHYRLEYNQTLVPTQLIVLGYYSTNW